MNPPIDKDPIVIIIFNLRVIINLKPDDLRIINLIVSPPTKKDSILIIILILNNLKTIPLINSGTTPIIVIKNPITTEESPLDPQGVIIQYHQ
jgi:hypothetical protein